MILKENPFYDDDLHHSIHQTIISSSLLTQYVTVAARYDFQTKENFGKIKNADIKP